MAKAGEDEDDKVPHPRRVGGGLGEHVDDAQHGGIETEIFGHSRHHATDHFVAAGAPQFFLARTEVIRQLGGWFAPLKMGDQQELFLRLKETGHRVLHLLCGSGRESGDRAHRAMRMRRLGAGALVRSCTRAQVAVSTNGRAMGRQEP